MRTRLTLAATVVFWFTPTFVGSQDAKKDQMPNELPRTWDIKEIDKASPPYGNLPGRFYVLAWHSSKWTYMGNEYTADSCLVLRVLDEGGEYGRWCLAHVYRSSVPAFKEFGWHLSMHHATGGEAGPTGIWYLHAQRFKTRPGNKEIYNSLPMSSTGVGWRFDREEGCVDCGVCEKSWQEAIGEKPTRFFGKAAKEKSAK